ncbi:MAG: PIG-L family deacetylase [Candidatus Omnitrophica bacterium]|nr:PIG-L family deacetylase [Candidatus Omnitrophota bacterium]
MIFCVTACAYSEPAAPVAQSPVSNAPLLENFKNTDRILILAPHPDDEAIACAGVIQNALKAGSSIRVAYLTNGDHNQFAFIVFEKRLVFKRDEFIYLGELRRKEATAAMNILGLNKEQLVFLGYPDFGTFAVFARYWQRSKPYMSWLTRISSVPYKGDLSFGATYTGESILSDLKRVLMDYKPNKIFVSHPADTNPDHRAYYLFLEIALADLERFIGKPQVYSYLVHSYGWPVPRHYHPQLFLEPPKQFQNSPVKWNSYELTAEELNKKYMAILSYKTQTASSAFYLLSFARRNELFGSYPEARLANEPKGPEGKLMGVSILDDLMRGTSKEEAAEEDKLVLRGQGKIHYEFENNSLVVTISKPQSAGSRFTSMTYIFGYSKHTPFEKMPKICVITRNKSVSVFDANQQIDPDGTVLENKGAELVITVPMKIIGNPDFVLTAVRTQSGLIEYDSSAFRKIILK